MIKRILKKLIHCGKHYSRPNKISHSMHGIVLLNTSDALFELYRTMTKEVKWYCKKEGFDIDEIYFFTSYNTSIVKNIRNIKSNNKSKIHIIEEGEKTIVHVLMDTTITKNE